MATPKTKGRMITKDISDSKRFAELSPDAAVLFCMLIPHYNAHGKLNGDPGFLKGEVCPRIPYLSIKNIANHLRQITQKTNVKWFEHDGRYWIHSTNFLEEHQKLDPSKLGQDLLPSYSGLSAPEVEVEVEDKEEGKRGVTRKPKPRAFGVAVASENSKKIYEYYCREIRSHPTSKARALTNIDRLLAAGETPELLWECINQYIDFIAKEKTEETYRKVCANFFGVLEPAYIGFREKAKAAVEAQYGKDKV